MALLVTWPAAAELWVPAVFSDHAVLQRQRDVPVWGIAEPGASVVVTFGEQTHAAQADAEGRWRVTLSPMPATSEGRELVIESGEATRKVRDVLVGEVWLCSGQSNMDWKVRNAEEKDALLATADQYPQVRFLRTEHGADFNPRRDVGGRWQVSGDDDTEAFSAVAYCFARRLHDVLGVPVGILQSSIGGTGVWAWTDPSAMRDAPALGPDRVWLAMADRLYATRERAALRAHETWMPQARALADAERSADLPDAPAWPTHDAAQRNRPGSFHHAMIAPLSPYALRGFAWYQGEHNVGEGGLYAVRLEALLLGWRTMWADPTLPALIVHLPPHDYGSGPDRPDNALPWLVEAQQRVSAQPHNLGVVINDLGNPRDIHPRQKQPVGQRMANQYLAAHTQALTKRAEGPRMQSASFAEGTARVTFEFQGELTTRDGEPPEGFALAGEDGVFHEVTATIEGEAVVLSSQAVPSPTAVRFAFDELAAPNLTDDTRLPAMAFRTDDQPDPFSTQQRVTLPLWSDGVPMNEIKVDDELTINERVRNISEPTVELFFPRGFGDGVARPAVLIFPGGGYGYLSIEHEGKRVARRLNEAGMVAGVVKNRVVPYRAPVPWLDGTQAVRLLRAHATELGIDAERIGVLGFSAGGHVAACVSVMPDDASRDLLEDSASPELSASARPDFTVLVYPVVSMHPSVSHGGSARNLLGPTPSEELVGAWSADLYVDADTPPALLVHCANDGVSIANSERYIAALTQHGVPHEFLRYETGGHGFGLGGEDHPAAGWIDRAIAWIEKLPNDGSAK